MSNKTPIYFMPGLAASSKIFEHIRLPEDDFDFHFLEWLIPESPDESLEHYSRRICENIKDPNPILIGVSFGGFVIQEICKFIEPKKVILISSIKHHNELPKRLKFLQLSKLYKLFPSKKISKTDDFTKYNLTKSLKKKAELYNKFLNIKDEKYLNWAIHNVLNWKPNYECKNLIHIHGSEDSIFPIKYIKNCIIIEGGTHSMVLNKAKQINLILKDNLTDSK